MQAHRTASIVAENGTLTLDALPFANGQRVEVIVLPAADDPVEQEPTEEELLASLAGRITRYERPHDAVLNVDDIDCLRSPDQAAG